MESGKAFEYSILKEFKEKLDNLTNVEIIVNHALKTAKQCFESFTKEEQEAPNSLFTNSLSVSHGV